MLKIKTKHVICANKKERLLSVPQKSMNGEEGDLIWTVITPFNDRRLLSGNLLFNIRTNTRGKHLSILFLIKVYFEQILYRKSTLQNFCLRPCGFYNIVFSWETYFFSINSINWTVSHLNRLVVLFFLIIYIIPLPTTIDVF